MKGAQLRVAIACFIVGAGLACSEQVIEPSSSPDQKEVVIEGVRVRLNLNEGTRTSYFSPVDRICSSENRATCDQGCCAYFGRNSSGCHWEDILACDCFGSQCGTRPPIPQ
jgi:hypothetical protein